MRRIVMRVRTAELAEAYDCVLPLLRGGVHPQPDGDTVVLMALGDDGELPPAAQLAQALGPLLLGQAVEEDAGPDLVTALARAVPPVAVAGRILLRTAHHEPPPDGWIDIVLERGAGFGLGTHPTTRHCLQLLLGLEPGGAFADLGCGAGALVIAAAKLGYAPVVGVDLLPEVTATALRNAQANQVDVDVVTGDLRAVDGLDVRVAVCNVSEPAVHEALAPARLDAVEILIVSGLPDAAQLDPALGRYAAAGLHEQARIDDFGWVAVLLTR